MIKRHAFTIIELVMVIAIIGVLMSIVTTTAQSAIRSARNRKADVCVTVANQGVHTYYAQKDRWPGSIGNEIKRGDMSRLEYNDGESSDWRSVPSEDIRDMIYVCINEAKSGNPMMDISGLYVSRRPGTPDSSGRYRDFGLDFWDAVRGNKHSKKRMRLKEMYFGYPDADGHFHEFSCQYSIPTDSMRIAK